MTHSAMQRPSEGTEEQRSKHHMTNGDIIILEPARNSASLTLAIRAMLPSGCRWGDTYT
jgi:hypothetical protein